MARLHRFASDDSSPFRRRHVAAALPSAGGRVEATHLFKDEGDEAGDFRTLRRFAIKERGGAAAQFVFGVAVQRRWRVAGEFSEAGGV